MKTDAFTTQHFDTRDPLSLLNAHLHALLLRTLCGVLELSLEELPSLYLAKSRSVPVEKSENKSSMRYDLHIKEENHPRDAAILTVTFHVEGKSC